MRVLPFSALALCLAVPALAGEGTPAPNSGAQPQAQSPAQPGAMRDMKTLLQELRDLDASQDMDGDHVVGEHLC